jgi:HD-like signal output (HDOD) protein
MGPQNGTGADESKNREKISMKLVEQSRYLKLKASGRLPSPKGLALSIIRLVHRDNFNIAELVRLVKSDPAISGELLKFSNSASFARSQPVVAISDAVTILGARQVGVIVTAFTILHGNRSGTCPEFDYEKFWSRSLASAIATQFLSKYAKFSTEECFTAGLLSTLGELALAAIFPQRYGEIIAMPHVSFKGRLDLEREAFGNDHRELNATMLLEWGLPLEIVTAIYLCEAPDEGNTVGGSRSHGLKLSLNLALAFAEICVADDHTRKTKIPSLLNKAAKLGINTEEMHSISALIISSWNEWGAQLKILTNEFELPVDNNYLPQ